MLHAINLFLSINDTWVQGVFQLLLRTCPANKLGCSSFLLNKVRRKYDEEGVLCLDVSKDDSDHLKRQIVCG